MKTLLLLALCLVASIESFAQGETYDIATFQAPAGWTKQETNYALAYSIVDNTAGTWCQLGIYKSVPSGPSTSADFASEWKALVKPETYAGATLPAPSAKTNDGWTISSGTSNFQWQNRNSQITLVNINGYGTMMSFVISTNSNRYNKDIDTFVNSIVLSKPAVAPPVVPTQTQTQTQATTSTPTVSVTNAPGNSGIVRATTNFDDGWVAQPFADFVQVKRNQTTVLLHYAVALDDRLRGYDNMAGGFWEMLIAPRYQTNNVRTFQNEPYTYNKVYFMEADAVEGATGKKCYVGLRVLIANGVARAIEIITPDAATLMAEFGDQAKIESMMNYNKFAVSPQDIVGKWEESSSTGVQMYNTVTGQYAGMNASASANSFEIKADGTYDSNHKGAYGMVGSMQFYDQKYHGKYTLTTWDITMTNRFKGKTDVYWCQYEAVRGGRVLRLADKSASAMTYALVKTN